MQRPWRTVVCASRSGAGSLGTGFGLPGRGGAEESQSSRTGAGWGGAIRVGEVLTAMDGPSPAGGR